MESGSGSKSWDHAWTTDQMRENRRNWSLAGDTGLLKHLEHLSDNITKKAEETKEALNSMTTDLNEAAILVDNITNSSLALANTQFIESRVLDDNIELEQPDYNADKVTEIKELSANELLGTLFESIKSGLAIIDEKFEKVEIVDSDSSLPRYVLKPKDPYKHRRLPYVIDSEEWKASSKVGLETSSESESEQNDNEDFVNDTVVKNVSKTENFVPPPPPPPPTAKINLGVGKLSSTSSESSISNNESNSIKGIDRSKVDTRSQDTLNSGTEASTPSTSLPKTQTVNHGPPSFAEELAKRLGNVFPAQRNVIVEDTKEQKTNLPEDDLFSQKEDQEIFSNKSDGLFSKGKNLFSDDELSWKNKPARPVNKNIIPPSLDVPPPLSVISSAPKSNIDDLFGDVEDSDDSDDIFSKKPTRDSFVIKKDAVKSEVSNKQLNLSPENSQNSSIVTGSTPKMNDKVNNLFEDEDDDDDLFKSVPKQEKPSEVPPAQGAIKKKPIGGVSIFGHVDILSSTKFPRRASSSSSSSADDSGNINRRSNPENLNSTTRGVDSSKKSENSDKNLLPSEASNNIVNSTVESSNISSNINSGGTSGVSMRQSSSDIAGSSLGTDFQPLMSSSRLKTEDIYRERGVTSDSLLATRSSSDHQQHPEPPSQLIEEDASEENEDAFGPPPLPKPGDAIKSKSKVASLFDDSDSDSDLFASASPSSLRSQRSSEPTPSKTAPTGTKKKSIFDDDDDDLFGGGDAPEEDIFSSVPVKSISKVPDGLFDNVEGGGLFSEIKKKKSKVTSLFGEDSEKEELFSEVKKPEKSKDKVTSLFSDPEDDLFGAPKKVIESKKVVGGLFADTPKVEVDHSKEPTKIVKSEVKSTKQTPSSLFGDESDLEDDLFSSPKKVPNVKEKSNLFGESTKNEVTDSTQSTSSLFDNTVKSEFTSSKESLSGLSTKSTKSEIKISKPQSTNLFNEDSGPEDDLFKDSASKKITGERKKEINLFSDSAINEVKVNPQSLQESIIKEPAKITKEPVKVEQVTENKSSKGLFDDDSEDTDLFGKVSKPVIPEKPSSSKGLFEDTSDSELFGSSSKTTKSSTSDFEKPLVVAKSTITNVKKEPYEEIFKKEPEVTKPKKLTTSIFDESDDDDLFGNSSLSKKKTSSIFKEDQSIAATKKMDKEKKKSTEKLDEKPKEKKPDEKSSIFDDDDDDDLFGDKKKKSESEKPKVEEKPSTEPKKKTDSPAKPAARAVLAEIKQKLEKHNLLEQKNKSETAVDGAMVSKKEPPKSLKIQTNLPIPNSEDPSNQPVPKKPVVSGKIKNLMGKMGDFKILSPTDTPPLLRKSTEEKIASENELEASVETAGSEESTPSLPSGASSPQTSGTNSKTRESPSLKSDNTEVAVSFDEPAQVETLSSIASSKSRARIPKRRPQSRQARHSALLHSGIDFDVVDASPTSPPSLQPNGDADDNVDRLLPSRASHAADDRSEISISRNTTTNLLSPSTDEEDLFDVPPDLPEDPAAKEDSLFGRAPILSPVETLKKTKEQKVEQEKSKEEKKSKEQKKEEDPPEEKKEPVDPLRDDSHDPLKDPSQLFAFVTKTPSPEKSKGLLLNEDDSSLFSSSTKTKEKVETKPKPSLFDDEDDSSNDLFSSKKTKLSKKPLKDTKIDIFNEAESDDDGNLFGSASKKNTDVKNKDSASTRSETSKTDKMKESKNVKSVTKDIFNNSSDEDDIFSGSKQTIPKKKTTTSLFDGENDNSDNDDLFGTPKLPSMKENESSVAKERPILKKAITKDLKKTAEKIVEDPLSLLQDD